MSGATGALGLLLQLLLLVELGRAAAINSTLERDYHTTNLTLCQIERYKALMPPILLGRFVPTCREDGTFTPLQIWDSTGGYSWCVNIYTGVQIPGTLTPPVKPQPRCDSNGEPFAGDFCPLDRMRYGVRCFIFIQEPTRWIQAQGNCMFHGGNLASVHSPEENRFLQKLTLGASFNPPRTWIGANDCMQPGVWMWTDGSMFDYDNFAQLPIPIPNDPNENCVQMNFGVMKLWMKASCESPMPYICANHI